MSLEEGLEFQPGPKTKPSIEEARRLFTGQSKNAQFNTLFVDGNVQYEPYSQAWRFLGWYIDCEESIDNENTNDSSCQLSLLWAAVSIRS